MKLEIPFQSFPDSRNIDSETYGLQVAKAIQYEWFRKDGSSCLYYNRWQEFHKRRLYSMGLQPMQKYKNLIAINGDLSYTNIDFTPIAVARKFVNIVVNGMQDRQMSVKAESQDIMSAEGRSELQRTIETDMYAKQFLKDTQLNFGIDAFSINQDNVPEDSDELSLYMQLNFKPAIEIAEEIAIDTIFKENLFDEKRRRAVEDLTVCGMGVLKHDFLKGDGIKTEYVDCNSFVHSYTEDPYFQDMFYNGEVKTVHKTELYKINPNITDKEVEEIASLSSTWYDMFPNLRQYDLFQKETVNLLYFNYKAKKDFVFKRKFKKNGGESVIRKEADFNPVENENFEKQTLPKDVWYSGILVLGTEKLIKWELQQNMVRPKSTTQHAYSNYVAIAPEMYKGNINSLTSRMIPFIDQMQLTFLKLQQIMSKINPDGVFVDIDSIAEIDLGAGGNYGPIEALNMFYQTGSMIGRSITEEGGYNNGRQPIQELVSSASQNKMMALLNNWNNNLNMIRDITGLNEARDASTPDPKSLVGLQKLAALNSNTATRHILDSSIFLTKKIAECVSNRIADVLEYSDMAEELAMKIGKYNVGMLDEIKSLYLSNFGIFIELSPDEEERAALEANISICLQEQTIELEDAMDIRQVASSSIKLANELLKFKKRKREKQQQEQKEEDARIQQEFNLQSQEVSNQAALAKLQAETEGKLAVQNAKTQGEIAVLNAEVQAKFILMEKEFEMKKVLVEMEGNVQSEKIDRQEAAKDKRIEIQGTQASVLIDQRHKGKPPVDFESTNDTLGDFDLEAFEPR